MGPFTALTSWKMEPPAKWEARLRLRISVSSFGFTSWPPGFTKRAVTKMTRFPWVISPNFASIYPCLGKEVCRVLPKRRLYQGGPPHCRLSAFHSAAETLRVSLSISRNAVSFSSERTT